MFNTLPIVSILAGLASVAAVVLLCIFVLPAKKREKLPRLGKMAHDFFNFKDLYLEVILRVVYVLATVWCVIQGALMLFGFSVYESYYYGGTHVTWYGGYGLLLIILGPIALRLAFEGIMMFILLVKNTIQINNKLKNQNDDAKEEVIEESVETEIEE